MEQEKEIEIKEHQTEKPLKKILMFTDIHFGKKNNSIAHNQDCLNFLEFLISKVKQDAKVDAIAFLGDWFENRNAINVMTMHYASIAIDMLDALGLPIFFIIGNHDIYHRHTRDVYSTKPFKNKKNIIIVDSFLKVNDDILFAPFLFHEEYPQLSKFNDGKTKYAFGHFEFRNFVLTGTHQIMERGPEHTNFNKFTYIFSGHFHKRQYQDNTIYIGNTFPMDYGDAGDSARGICTLDFETEKIAFIDWPACPRYFKIDLSTLIESSWEPPEFSRVSCKKDIEITYSEVQDLKEAFITQYNLREFKIEESFQERKQAITEGQELNIDSLDLVSLDETIMTLIRHGIEKSATIDPEKLCEEYDAL